MRNFTILMTLQGDSFAQSAFSPRSNRDGLLVPSFYYNNFSTNSADYRILEGFGYRIAPSPNNFARINILRPELPVVSVTTDSIYTEKGQYARFSVNSDRTLSTPIVVDLVVSQEGNAILGNPPSIVRLQSGTQSTSLLINTKGSTADDLDESISVMLQTATTYLVSPQNYSAKAILVEDSSDLTSVSELSISSLFSTLNYRFSC